MNSFQLLLIHSPLSFIFVNIHICMLIFTPQSDVFFIYYAHAFVYTCTVCVFVAKEGPKEDWLPANWVTLSK